MGAPLVLPRVVEGLAVDGLPADQKLEPAASLLPVAQDLLHLVLARPFLGVITVYPWAIEGRRGVTFWYVTCQPCMEWMSRVGFRAAQMPQAVQDAGVANAQAAGCESGSDSLRARRVQSFGRTG